MIPLLRAVFDTPDFEQPQADVVEAIQNPEKGCLVGQQARQQGFSIGLIIDRQLIEPTGPLVGQVTLYPDLVKVWLIHSAASGRNQRVYPRILRMAANEILN
jgi:hypothetical protein